MLAGATPDPSRESFERGSSGRAVLTFLLLIAGAVGGLGDLLESRVDSSRGTSLRNPHLGRDWAHHAYHATPRRADERLIILISNSQGYGRSVPDDKTYAALLQDRWAGAEHGAVRVLNWSVPAGVGPDFVLLAAAARRLDPTVVLVVTSGGNFSESALTRRGRDTPLAGFSSDAYHLTAFSQVRSHLPARFRDEYLDASARIDALLARSSKLWRHREIPLRELRIPGWREAFLGQRLRLERAEAAEARASTERLGRGPDGPPTPRRTFVATQSTSFLASEERAPRRRGDRSQIRWRLFQDLLDASPETSRVIIALMPLRSTRPSSRRSFVAEAARRAADSGAELWNLSTAVPDREFDTRTHFDARGHLRFSQVLAERLGS